MSVDIRRIEPSEIPAFVASVEIPFLDPGNDDHLEFWARTVEPARTWVAVDDGRFVGNAAVLTRDVTVPGPDGRPCPTVPLAAVTAVGVHATHRRHGILRRLMTEMLDDGRRRGEPAAGLLASEAAIYGRFGFGQATAAATVVVGTGQSRFAIDAPRLDLRIVDVDEAAKVLPDLFDRLRRNRAGQVDRPEGTWASAFADRVRREDGGRGLIWVVGDKGFTSYRAHPVDNIDGFDQARLEVRDLMGATPDVEAGLWRYLLDIDLVTDVTAWRRAVDDPLRWRLSDPRQVCTRFYGDMLWLRPLDVAALLEARSYSTPGQLVIHVMAPSAGGGGPTDAVGTGAGPTDAVGTGPGSDHPGDDDVVAGRWSVEAGPDGVSVRRVRPGQAADLHLGVAELGALYLGGVGATTLASAGRLVEERPGAIRLADRLFAATPSPLSSTGF
ncbi:MAG: GNAT family N-acetyltransferase [Acidimicrobiales bacterium]